MTSEQAFAEAVEQMPRRAAGAGTWKSGRAFG